jgi:hypothetical protein
MDCCISEQLTNFVRCMNCLPESFLTNAREKEEMRCNSRNTVAISNT